MTGPRKRTSPTRKYTTSSPRKLDLLLQIPIGSMPVLGGRETKSVQINLQPYQTQSIEYFFYFPSPGEFPHYAVHVAQRVGRRIRAQ